MSGEVPQGTTAGIVTLEERWTKSKGHVLLTGTQALVRLLIAQRERDIAAGLNTAGYVSGYRGSPLGGLDQQLWKARARLEAANIRFQPGVNEDLAATAIWGTQQAPLLPEPAVDGVFAMWYGKGPGVDRSGDPIKHANRQGTSKHGGVLLVFGDDHAGKSSTVAHQSEPALATHGVPVLYPANVQELLDLGLHGYAMSRHAGVWVGLKCVNEAIESTSTVQVDIDRIQPVRPGGIELPPDGVHARISFDVVGDEIRLMRHKLPLAQAYARENRLDRITHGEADAPTDRRVSLGIVAAGKTWLDVTEALTLLGLGPQRLAAVGVAVYKPALIWPLEPTALEAFARGRTEILVIEEKSAFMEPQIASALFNLSDGRPRLVGKRCERGLPLLAADVQLTPLEIARVIAARLELLGMADSLLRNRLSVLESAGAQVGGRRGHALVRAPHFCSGCPHNLSTKVPEGSLALAGIGCHTMALLMPRNTVPPTQMGGEGLNWTGIAPFSNLNHVFQNLGDGTYFHSGLLAVRGAVAAGVNITYKILVNDAVAMTGGQPVEGQLSVAEIATQLRAERVRRIAVVTDEPSRLARLVGFPPGVTLHPREHLDAVQREMRMVRGVSAILYEQTCAAEKRRRRKRGKYPLARERVFINELVCEGCGDCSAQSNCASIQPVETEFGRKRKVDQSGCNQDLSCVNGFCPSFVTVEGAALRKPGRATLPREMLAGLPAPVPCAVEGGIGVLVAGVGGTGVVTVGAILAMAAHIEDLMVNSFDMTGLAQKGGAVLSHVRFARDAANLGAARIGPGQADVILGCDSVVAASTEVLRSVRQGRTRVVINSHLTPTASFQTNPDLPLDGDSVCATVEHEVGNGFLSRIDAHEASVLLVGDATGANMLLVGFALQKGWLPVRGDSIERAIELNGAGVQDNLRSLLLGRIAAHDPLAFSGLLQSVLRDSDAAPCVPVVPGGMEALRQRIELRAAYLVDYQDTRYAERYRTLVNRVEAGERALPDATTALTEAVALSYFKLLAYKDEYEVARLHSVALRDQLESVFSEGYRVSLHLAPPWLSPRDPVTGLYRKRRFGPWILPVLRGLSRLKVLRGTSFDPFAYTADRRLERRLIVDYERLVEELLAGLAASNHSLAVELASLPQRVRGFGHVKVKAAEGVLAQSRLLLEKWRRGGHHETARDA